MDLHVHSEYSDRPYSWFLRSLGSAECYTRVSTVYDTAISRGMNLVTVTDHDDIRGSLALMELGHANTFVSEEVSARFPEDGCVVHTIAVGITEAQHDELQRLRGNVYELVSYMHAAGIPHFLAHPLSQVNGRLTASHLQRCLLMFSHLELTNGVRDRAHVECLERILAGLTREDLARFADAHPAAPALVTEPHYGVVGGSDDHGMLSIARAYTSFDGPPTVEGLLRALARRETRADGLSAQCEVLGHNAYAVTAANLRKAGHLGPMLDQLRTLDAAHACEAGERGRAAAARLAKVVPIAHTDEGQAVLADEIGSVTLDLQRRAWADLFARITAADIHGASRAIAPLVELGLLGLPYLLGARYHVRDRASAHRFATELGFESARRASPRVLVATDSIDAVDGVSIGLRRLAAEARTAGLDLRLAATAATAARVYRDEDGVVRFPSVHDLQFQVYSHYRFGIPAVNALMRYMSEHDIDLVQCSTPGPMGMAAFVAARILGVPVIGQFHTDLPEYVGRLTGDPMAGAIAARVTGALYAAMDAVLVPSESTRARAAALGVPAHKLQRVARGVDLALFRPERRRPDAYAPFGINGETKVVYVGRVSKEKGLDALFAAFARIQRARLVIIGDGPIRDDLARAHRQLVDDGRVVFAGVHLGEALATLYASADVFVSPSETETFGNTVVEAQASGLPAIVASRGAARELIVDGATGFVVDARNPDQLGDRIAALVESAEQRRQMARAAATHARSFGLDAALADTFARYRALVAPRGEGAEA